MANDYFVQVQVDAFHKRCKQNGVQFSHGMDNRGEIITLKMGSKVQRYLIPKKPSWMPNDDELVPQKLNNFLDQFLKECAP